MSASAVGCAEISDTASVVVCVEMFATALTAGSTQVFPSVTTTPVVHGVQDIVLASAVGGAKGAQTNFLRSRGMTIYRSDVHIPTEAHKFKVRLKDKFHGGGDLTVASNEALSRGRAVGNIPVEC